MPREAGDSDDWNYGRQAMWEHNLEKSIEGKRGQQALRDLRQALLDLPEKRLIEGALCTVARTEAHAHIDRWSGKDTVAVAVKEKGKGVCAVGAYIWQQNRKKGMSDEEAFKAIPTLEDEAYTMDDTAMEGMYHGLTFTLAWHLAYKNDDPFELGRMTPEGRYNSFMEWLNDNIA